MNKLEAYQTLVSNSFEMEINCNDFFEYSTAWSVRIFDVDYSWVVEHIEKWGTTGLDACLAYIQNKEPLKPLRTDEFNQSIKELVDRKQTVGGDIEVSDNLYFVVGPYRTINRNYEDI